MKLIIVGQDSLWRVTTECCAWHFQVLARPDPTADVLWICYDTPIVNDVPVPEWVMDQIRAWMPSVHPRTLVLVSSQMPVGTTHRLEEEFPDHTFAHSPENIRVAHGVADFRNQARVVVGTRTAEHKALLEKLFAPFTNTVLFTDPETAEMCKHVLNCFLGLQIAFINEVARVAEAVGADPILISKALLSEARVSPKAPLRPGAPFGGGHLTRDIVTLTKVAEARALRVPIIARIRESNEVVSQ